METETTEYKQSLAELKQGLISLVAMLNKHAVGELWFGIAPDGTTVGLDITEKTLRDVSQQIAAHIEPRIYPEISRQTVDGKPVNTTRLFFADTPIELRCAVFASQTSATILDRHDYTGDILELIEEAQKYVLQNIHIGMQLDGLRRVDVPEIARETLREAIINAFCHRDWRDPDYIQIAIYKDRVEIRNPGGLYDGLTLEDLRRGNVSRRRNPLIAEILRRIHLVEAWGRGVPLMLENAPTVTFRAVGGLFVASFVRPTVHEKSDQTAENPIKKPLTPAPKSTTARDTLLQQLRQHADMSIPDLAAATDLSRETVRYHLDQLKRNGALRRHGPKNGGWWEVIQDRP